MSDLGDDRVVATGHATASKYATWHRRGAVAWITLSDPQAGNPIHPEMVRQVHDAVRQARADRVKVIVLSAEGPFFSVGGDISRFVTGAEGPRYMDDLVDGLNRLLVELNQMPAIVLTVVQGAAAGGGFPLAAAGDIVLCSTAATFSLGHTRLGLTVDAGASVLSRTLGMHRLMRLALLNERMSAAEAQAAGLVSRVVEEKDLLVEAAALAGRLAEGPRDAQATVKRLVRDGADRSLETMLRAELIAIREAVASAEADEGVAAFTSKREPRFAP